MPRRLSKHKLLLDEGIEPRTFFPELNNLFNLKHITHDYKFTGLTDRQVYEIAVKEKRIVVTYNVKDFKPLATLNPDSGIIGLTSNISSEDIDKKLTALLRKKKVKELYKKFTPLQNIYEEINRS